MKKFIFSIAIISMLACLSTTTSATTISGTVYFNIKLVDASWTTQTYDLYVTVIANGNQYSTPIWFDNVPQPGPYGLYSIAISDIPYPAPISPYTYQIYVRAVRDDGHGIFNGWQYATASYTPFGLTANALIVVQ